MDAKQRAAEAALVEVRDGMIVGLGSGSTAECFIRALGDALRARKVRDIRGIPTSVNSERLARELSIPLVGFADIDQIDVTIDGADEIAPDLSLIKGLGGALLREKIVAQNSKRLVIIADESKTVNKLGTRSPLPVEVLPFAIEATERFLISLGASPALRSKGGKPYVTDNGNQIFDCRFAKGIEGPRALEVRLAHRAGIVETGLFLRMARVAYVARGSDIDRMQSPS